MPTYKRESPTSVRITNENGEAVVLTTLELNLAAAALAPEVRTGLYYVYKGTSKALSDVLSSSVMKPPQFLLYMSQPLHRAIYLGSFLMQTTTPSGGIFNARPVTYNKETNTLIYKDWNDVGLSSDYILIKVTT